MLPNTSIDNYRATEPRMVAGIMSGTSLDGIDVAITELSGAGSRTRFQLLGFTCVPFSREMSSRLHEAVAGRMTLRETFELDADLGETYADAVIASAAAANLPLASLSAVGLHGQTVYHAPDRRPNGVTAQIGSPAVLAGRLRTLVVSNFRAADVAAGGHGAPLVPYCDYLLLHSPEKNRVALNIGGIANITWLPANARPGTLIAFDTGPGNVLIDAAMRVLYGRQYDPEGSVASQGSIDEEWLGELSADEYFAMQPPKSTGRERFGEESGRLLTEQGIIRGMEPEDILATLTSLTARTIAGAVREFASGDAPVDELIVAGGGLHNRTLMRMLAAEFPGTAIVDAAMYGLPGDAKEAVCFAILANEALHEIPANLPSVTGASRQVVCGTITTGRGTGIA